MKVLNSMKVVAISAVASLVLVGCGGSSSGTTTSAATGTTISGTAIDPEIQGANVYVDANENGKYDVGETNTTTDNLGKYSLTISDADIGKPIIVEGGVDRVTKENFKGKLKLIAQKAKTTGQFITPLTTMVAEAKQTDANKSLADIKDELATKLGLASADDLDKDILTDTKLLKIALRIQKVTQTVADASGKDISGVYNNLVVKLSKDDFDTALQGTIDDMNQTSFEYKRARDLAKELKNVDEQSLDAEKLALTIDNIERNISAATTQAELDDDLFNKDGIVVRTAREAKDLKEKKVFEKLGFKGLSDSVKTKLATSDTLDFDKDTLENLKSKILENKPGLSGSERQEIDREKLFDSEKLQSISEEAKQALKDRLESESFDFSQASAEDLLGKIQEGVSSMTPATGTGSEEMSSGSSTAGSAETMDAETGSSDTTSSTTATTTETTSSDTTSTETTSNDTTDTTTTAGTSSDTTSNTGTATIQ